jgi:Flp pilus assembly protein TadB
MPSGQMLESWKRELARLEQSKPGERFRDRYARKHTEGSDRPRMRFLYIAGGCALCAIALILGLLPFMPGATLVTLGAALIARESLSAAKALDWAELRLRRWWADMKAAGRKFFGRG